MTWLCDYERCYRDARLFRMTDGRDRPRCALHQGPRVPTEEYRRAEAEALLAREKPLMRWGKGLVVDVMSEAWARQLVQNYASLEERAFAEAAKDSEKLGVLPQIPQAKDGDALFFSTDSDCVAGVSGVARVTVGPEGVVYHDVSSRIPWRRHGPTTPISSQDTLRVRTSSCAHTPANCDCDGPPKNDATRLMYDQSKPAPSFRVGQWVRRNGASGSLGKIEALEQRAAAGTCMFIEPSSPDGTRLIWWDYDCEPAIPRAGEWWVWKTCDVHGQRANYADVPMKMSVCDPTSAQYVSCGCLAPVNFGRGNANPEAKA